MYRDEHEALVARTDALERENATLKQQLAEKPPAPVPVRAPTSRAPMFALVSLTMAFAGIVTAIAWVHEPVDREIVLPGYDPTVGPAQDTPAEATMAAALASVLAPGASVMTRHEATVVNARGVAGVETGTSCVVEQRVDLGDTSARLLVRCGAVVVYDEESGPKVRVEGAPTDLAADYKGKSMTLTRVSPPLDVVLRLQ